MNDVLSWLLEEENPAIKYRTLTEICDEKPETHKNCYDSIWEHKQIKRMLSKQNEHGLWSNKDWGNMAPLHYLSAFAEFGVQRHERLDNYVSYTINLMQSLHIRDLIGCATPLILRALVMMG